MKEWTRCLATYLVVAPLLSCDTPYVSHPTDARLVVAVPCPDPCTTDHAVLVIP